MVCLDEILKITQGKIVCVLNETIKAFSNAQEAIECNLYKDCIVSGISVQENAVILTLHPFHAPLTEENGKWVDEHQRQFGETPSFF